jgi:hypothetical protein
MANNDELLLSLKKANSERKKKRTEMMKVSYYSKLFQFLESRFSDGETFSVLNYFEHYKMITKDKDNNDKTVYGFICDNNKSYLGLNDLAFPKRLYKRTIVKIDGVETTEYKQLDKKIPQGDLAILFELFKNKYKDSLLAFELLYMAIAEYNESKFISEAFVYPTETYQRFKGEYTNGNFYLFNLKAGGTDQEDLGKIFKDICEIYESSNDYVDFEEVTDDSAADATDA